MCLYKILCYVGDDDAFGNKIQLLRYKMVGVSPLFNVKFYHIYGRIYTLKENHLKISKNFIKPPAVEFRLTIFVI